MSVRRFMINSSAIYEGVACFDGNTFNHMVRVLRLVCGDTVQLADEKGQVHSGTIRQVTTNSVIIQISSTYAAVKIDSKAPNITICQALPKGDKIDLILQKGTELGAHSFMLFGGFRSVAKVRHDQLNSKLERWNRIAAEAARQCGRTDVPEVLWKPRASDAAGSSSQVLRLILWEDERDTTIKKVLNPGEVPSSVVVAIGPEGGFDPQEVVSFSQHGFLPVSLGSRILRTETASIAILAIMHYIWGDL